MKNKQGEKIQSAPCAQMIFTINTETELYEGDILIKNKDSKVS